MLAAIDFTTVEVWMKGGLVTFYLLFVMELKTRRIHFAGCTPNPDVVVEVNVGCSGATELLIEANFGRDSRVISGQNPRKFWCFGAG